METISQELTAHFKKKGGAMRILKDELNYNNLERLALGRISLELMELLGPTDNCYNLMVKVGNLRLRDVQERWARCLDCLSQEETDKHGDTWAAASMLLEVKWTDLFDGLSMMFGAKLKGPEEETTH